MAYDLDTLIARFRSDMEDTVEPYLWSQEEIIDYIGEAQDEFCQIVDVLNDELEVSYTAADPWVDIPYYVTRIRDAETSDVRKICLYNHEEWEDAIKSDDYGMTIVASDWKQKTGSHPEAMITDTKQDMGRLYPIPTVDGSFSMTVFRRPLEALADTEVLEVTDVQHQRCMLLKARSLGYLKHDTETFDAGKADDFAIRFEAKTDEIKSRVQRHRRRAKSVRYGGL